MNAVQKFFFWVSVIQIFIVVSKNLAFDFSPLSLGLLSALLVAASMWFLRCRPEFAKQMRREMPLIKHDWHIVFIVLEFVLLTIVFSLSYDWERFFGEKLSLVFHYARLLCCFHVGEFVFVVLHRPWQTELDSFVIYNNFFYQIAFAVAVIEFSLELYFFPETKLWLLAHWKTARVLVTCAGLLIRWASFQKLKQNFNHLIIKNDSQELVTTGIFAYERHPSYVGYYFFAVCLQAVAGNPVSLVLFAAVLWMFFRRRIVAEEHLLTEKYGAQYTAYRQKVSSIFDFKTEDLTGEK
jgi:protein-S-isoprenylcysteine O-methyltransferase